MFKYNSGTRSSRSSLSSNRNLPIRAPEEFEFGGVTQRWLAPGAVGGLQNPKWGQLDLWAQYVRRLAARLSAEFFVDLSNVTDNQSSIRDQDLVAGQGEIAVGEGLLFNRRAAHSSARE